ncbi:DUF3052 domain-containing protein [Saccharopolyspora halophila]|uniref:DUF3052 domain-containing protein n=1 Tax=Saccharopolyspora halophila TaxID=405551 RepID=A0ABN3GDW8_9PSEU
MVTAPVHWRSEQTVVAAGDAGKGEADVAEKLDIEPEMVVQELGWDEDVDDDVRARIEERCGSELLDEDADEVVDVVLLWWREDDGDLTDTLLDAMTPLSDDGVIWVLTPKTGRDGYVEPADIAEAASTANLAQTGNSSISEGWIGTRLAYRRAKARR